MSTSYAPFELQHFRLYHRNVALQWKGLTKLYFEIRKFCQKTGPPNSDVKFKYWSLSFFAFLVATFVTLGKYIFRTPIGNLLAFFQRLSVMIRCIIIVNIVNSRTVTVSSSKLDTSHLFGSPSKTPASLWINNCSSRAETSNHSNCVQSQQPCFCWQKASEQRFERLCLQSREKWGW